MVEFPQYLQKYSANKCLNEKINSSETLYRRFEITIVTQ